MSVARGLEYAREAEDEREDMVGAYAGADTDGGMALAMKGQKVSKHTPPWKRL